MMGNLSGSCPIYDERLNLNDTAKIISYSDSLIIKKSSHQTGRQKRALNDIKKIDSRTRQRHLYQIKFEYVSCIMDSPISSYSKYHPASIINRMMRERREILDRYALLVKKHNIKITNVYLDKAFPIEISSNIMVYFTGHKWLHAKRYNLYLPVTIVMQRKTHKDEYLKKLKVGEQVHKYKRNQVE